MKLGVNQWCFPEGYDLERCLELAAEAGFQGLEANIGEPRVGEGAGGPIPLSLTTASLEVEAEALRKRAAKAGIELHSLSTALHWTYSFTSADERVRDQAIEVAERMLALAAVLRAKTVLIVPGLVTEEVSYRSAYERALDAMRHLAAEAARSGVSIGIENVWNRFLLSPLEMRRFIEEIGSERVGAYLDVGNVLAFGYPEQWAEVLAELICGVHVKDFRLDVGNYHGFTALGHGDVSWPRVIDALRRAGYDGYLTVELPPRRFRPDQGVCEAARTLKAMVEGEWR